MGYNRTWNGFPFTIQEIWSKLNPLVNSCWISFFDWHPSRHFAWGAIQLFTNRCENSSKHICYQRHSTLKAEFFLLKCFQFQLTPGTSKKCSLGKGIHESTGTAGWNGSMLLFGFFPSNDHLQWPLLWPRNCARSMDHIPFQRCIFTQEPCDGRFATWWAKRKYGWIALKTAISEKSFWHGESLAEF